MYLSTGFSMSFAHWSKGGVIVMLAGNTKGLLRFVQIGDRELFYTDEANVASKWESWPTCISINKYYMLEYTQLTVLETLSIDVSTVRITQPFLELRRNKYLEHGSE